jgi:hypothetical protein
VCELDGPMPILKMSKTEMCTRCHCSLTAAFDSIVLIL